MKRLVFGWLLLIGGAVCLGCGALGETRDIPNENRVEGTQALKDAGASVRADVVGVLIDIRGTQRLCSGIVLDPKLVLTAQHCLTETERNDVAIDCATARLPNIDPEAVAWVMADAAGDAGDTHYHSVSSLRVPAMASRLCGDDLALLELAESLPGVSVPLSASVPPAGSEFLAVGYGADAAGEAALRQNAHAKVTCVGSDCQDTRVASAELLANSGACEGDSGSPALDVSGRAFAIAVRSSADCSESAYLQVAAHIDWLAANAIEVAASESRDPPQWARDVQTPQGKHDNDADAGPVGPSGSLTSGVHTAGCDCSTPRPETHRSAVAALLLLICGAMRWKKGARR